MARGFSDIVVYGMLLGLILLASMLHMRKVLVAYTSGYSLESYHDILYLPSDSPSSPSFPSASPSSNSSPSTSSLSNSSCNTTTCIMPPSTWHAQTGQDQFLYEQIFSHQPELCCTGIFVEFGARDGIEHSNTFAFEHYMGWTGLLFELDPVEYLELEHNRPGATVKKGAVCPSGLDNITVLLSTIGGHSGSLQQYESTRLENEREKTVIPCYHLADELKAKGLHRVDYMTMDTEGSEVDLVLDFPWDDFDIRVVQIEQLVSQTYTSQEGKKEQVIEHMLSHGYELYKVFEVAFFDTDDLMFVRNVPRINETQGTG